VNALSPPEKTIRLLFRIQVREDKVFTRFIRILRDFGFRIIDFDEMIRRIIGYVTIAKIESIASILKEYALSYSFEVTAIIKMRKPSVSDIFKNKELIGESCIKVISKYGDELLCLFCRHRCWLVKLTRNKGLMKVTLLKKPVSPLDLLSPYYYTFYDIEEVLSDRDNLINDLKMLYSIFVSE